MTTTTPAAIERARRLLTWAFIDAANESPEGRDRARETVAAALDDFAREALAEYMLSRVIATGHGDTIEQLHAELDWHRADEKRKAVEAVLKAAYADSGIYTVVACDLATRLDRLANRPPGTTLERVRAQGGKS